MIFKILLSRSAQTPNSDKNWKTSCPLQTFVCIISRHLEFIIDRWSGSPGQLGLRVAGFPVTGSLGHQMWPSSMSGPHRLVKKNNDNHYWFYKLSSITKIQKAQKQIKEMLAGTWLLSLGSLKNASGRLQQLVDSVAVKWLAWQPLCCLELNHLPLGLLVSVLQRQQRQRQNCRPHLNRLHQHQQQHTLTITARSINLLCKCRIMPSA